MKLQEEWIAKNDAGEYVIQFNPIGCTMTFGADDRQAIKTTDCRQALEWCRIAATVYGRTGTYKEMQIRITD